MAARRRKWETPIAPVVTVKFACNGKTFAVSDDGEYFFCEMPEEYAVPGTLFLQELASPVSELPEQERKEFEIIRKRLRERTAPER